MDLPLEVIISQRSLRGGRGRGGARGRTSRGALAAGREERRADRLETADLGTPRSCRYRPTVSAHS